MQLKCVLLCLFACLPFVVLGAKPEFYLWQQDWRDEVRQAAGEAAKKYRLHILCGVISEADGKLKFERAHADWDSVKDSGFVPVIRIRESCLGRIKKADKELADVLMKEFAAIPSECVELDVDCPESAMRAYGAFLTAFKKQLGKRELWLTVLPCHVSNPAFAEMTGAADCFILQVHYLEPPREGFQGRLLELKRAQAALEKAAGFGKPFLLALPSYAYEVCYERASGKVLGVSAETGGSVPNAERGIRTLAPDWGHVAALAKASAKTVNCQGPIFFRLPVKGERLNLDLPGILRLSEGLLPEERIEAAVVNNSAGALEVRLKNTSTLSCNIKVEIELDWGAEKRPGDGDTLSGFSSDAASAGILPTRLRGLAPPPGQEIPVAWFRPDTPSQIPKLKVNLLCCE